MAGLDCVTVEAQEGKKERERAEEMRKERSKKEKEAMTSVVLSDRLTSSSSSAAGETDDSDVDFTGPSHPKRSKVEGAKSTALLSADITSTLDRFKVSDRVAMGTTGAFATASGQDLGNLSLSRSTIRRHRIRNREAIANTGTAQGEAVLKAISEAQLQTRVQGLVFDTTASNTGLYEGACVKIQEGLGRELIWVACRHHVLEVVIWDSDSHPGGWRRRVSCGAVECGLTPTWGPSADSPGVAGGGVPGAVRLEVVATRRWHRFRTEILPLPASLTAYCLCGRASTSMPILFHS
ncbi:hypothetical protein GWK47_045420 [Chionoecetes opilio]|uniref:Uncharacterized protein n=1 Tax=Chionoecetes opilio TaxID=41210 RepID=A0A8J4Y7B3_CHIOP|nr:hypothetical protein GWK47_045420 [Chionoecetes opilio]